MKFKCAVIGLGRIGCGFDDNKSKNIMTHCGGYYHNHNTTLSALCDVDKIKLKKYGKKFKVKNLYKYYHQLFKNEKLDVVSICTSAESHLDIVEEAVQHNLSAIFLEKPISLSTKDAKKIVKLCNKNNIILQIDHQRRFGRFYQQLKHKIIDGVIGDVVFCNVFYGAGIFNTGTHVFDLLRFFFGDILQVKGKFSNLYSNNKSDPNVDGNLLFNNNLICNLQSLDYANYRVLEFDIFGKTGRIRLDLVKNKATIYTTVSSRDPVYGSLVKKYLNFPCKENHIVLALDDLVDSINNKKHAFCSGEDGFYALLAASSLIDSAKNHSKRIKLPKKTTF